MVLPARKYGNTTLYKLNRDNIIVKQVMSMDSALGKMVMEKMSEIPDAVKPLKAK